MGIGIYEKKLVSIKGKKEKKLKKNWFVICLVHYFQNTKKHQNKVDEETNEFLRK